MYTSAIRNTLIFCIVLTINTATGQHYRGMCALNDNTVWLSGSKGFVVRTNNGGLSWDTLNPKGYERKDFRDIHAWNDRRAIVMSSGDSGVVLETTNAGKTWKVILSDNSADIFWDALDVRDKKIVLVGDGNGQAYKDIRLKYGTKKFVTPIETYGVYHSIPTGGNPHWAKANSFYAASGSNVQWLNDTSFICIPVTKPDSQFSFMQICYNHQRTKNPNKVCFFYTESTIDLPFKKQKAGGPYSIRMRSKANGACVGGSYLKPESGDSAACYTLDSGKTWKPCTTMPNGYRSCVAFQGSNPIGICTGSNGTDITRDGGINWAGTAVKGYNVCAFTDNYIWLAGNKGSWERIAATMLFPK